MTRTTKKAAAAPEMRRVVGPFVTTFEVVYGMWNPRENKHSWCHWDECKTLKEAKEAAKIAGRHTAILEKQTRVIFQTVNVEDDQ